MTDTETKPFGGYGFAIRTFWISGTDLVVSRRWEREWLIEPNAVARFSTSITGKAASEKDSVCVIGKDRETREFDLTIRSEEEEVHRLSKVLVGQMLALTRACTIGFLAVLALILVGHFLR
jgi:hypothetical protein